MIEGVWVAQVIPNLENLVPTEVKTAVFADLDAALDWAVQWVPVSPDFQNARQQSMDQGLASPSIRGEASEVIARWFGAPCRIDESTTGGPGSYTICHHGTEALILFAHRPIHEGRFTPTDERHPWSRGDL